jgi:hypothetical protein
MKRFILSFLFALLALPSFAQSLTAAQVVTVRAAVCADATGKTFINNPNVPSLLAFINGASTTDAWMAATSQQTIFEATDVTLFDGLTQGKRDVWRLLMDNTPINFGRNILRKAVVDTWGTTNSVAVLTAFLEKATRAQAAIGGTSKTTNTVTGIDRTYAGTVNTSDATRLIFADDGTQFTCP